MKFENKGKWIKQINESAQKNEDNYQYTNGWPNKHRFDDIMQQIRGQKGLAKADKLSQQLAFVNSSSKAEELYNAWKNLIPEKQFVELIKSMSGSKEAYFKRFDLFDKKHKTESAQMNETRGYTVTVELGVPDNMNNRDIEDEVERLLRASNKINVVMDVTAERK